MAQPTIAGELDRRAEDNSPAKMLCDRITGATDWFGRLLPPPDQGGIAREAFVAQLLSMIRRNRQPAFHAAIKNDADSFLYAATDCAALNLKPGEEYWWVPFDDRSGGTGQHFTGMPGWKGEVQQIYRSGSVKSVKFGVVFHGDLWSWRPTRMETPEYEPLSEDRSRENLWKVYAYAEMMSGGISQVVVFTRSEVYRAKAKSKAAKQFWESEWEPEMWLKTALHRLFDYVPHSAGYNLQLMQAWAVALERYPALQLGAGDGDTPMALDPAASAGPQQVAGQVIARGPAAPVMPGNGQQHTTDDGDPADAAWREGTIAGKAEPVEPGKTKPDGKTEPAPASPIWPDVPLDDKVCRRTAGKLGAKWTAIGWTGDSFKEQRRVMAGLLAAGSNGGQPLDLKNPAQMTEGQARTAIVTFDALAAAAARDGEPLPDRVQRMFEEYTAALAKAAEPEG
jgi:phage RecT family recombinase